MEQEWAKRFQAKLQESGLTMKAASLKAGLNESFVRDMLQRKRVPSIDKLAKLAAVVGTTISELMAEAPLAPIFSVPLMGYIGAGAEIEPEFEQVPPDGLEQIQVPFPLPAEMIAFEVRGESMLPVYKDGWTIIVYKEQRRPIEAFYGEEAAVRTSDGHRFLKTIRRGAPGVSLHSFNAEPIENVHLEWVGEIFSILPRTALNKVARQGGIQGQLKLRA